MTKQVGLIQDVLGKELTRLITRNEQKDAAKHKLFHVYGYKNVYTVFPEELDDKLTFEMLRILFQAEKSEQNDIIIQK